MCTAFFAFDAHPSLLFLLVFNRDEFFDRATAPAAFWSTAGAPDLLAGRDLKNGGTWLGVTRGGRFALLTNFREANPNSVPGAPSRGALPTDFLRGDASPLAYLSSLDPDSHNGFNLVVGDLAARQVAYLTNRGADAAARGVPRALSPGVYGLSNGTLGCPGWAKVDRGVAAVNDLLASGRLAGVTPDGFPWGWLFDGFLADRQRAPHSALPATGVPRAIEHTLSSTFVAPCNLFGDGFTYGTRSQTGIAIWRDGAAALRERSAAEAETVCCAQYVGGGDGGHDAASSRPHVLECRHTGGGDSARWVTVEHRFVVHPLAAAAAAAKGGTSAAAPEPSRSGLVVDEEGECVGEATELAASV